MTAAQRDGGPAFPVTLFDGQTLGDGTANGMTLRDYFAAKAMQGLVPGPGPHYDYQAVAAHAYRYADAMLAARTEQPE